MFYCIATGFKSSPFARRVTVRRTEFAGVRWRNEEEDEQDEEEKGHNPTGNV